MRLDDSTSGNLVVALSWSRIFQLVPALCLVSAVVLLSTKSWICRASAKWRILWWRLRRMFKEKYCLLVLTWQLTSKVTWVTQSNNRQRDAGGFFVFSFGLVERAHSVSFEFMKASWKVAVVICTAPLTPLISPAALDTNQRRPRLHDITQRFQVRLEAAFFGKRKAVPHHTERRCSAQHRPRP